MSDNTALIQDLFGSIAQEGWSTKFNDALADDLVWVATGSSPVAGTYKGKQVYLEKIIKRLGDRLQSWPKPVVENLFVDGDTACIQFHGEGGVGKNGANFDMDYCWVMRLHEGRIAHVTLQRVRFRLAERVTRARGNTEQCVIDVGKNAPFCADLCRSAIA
jgi:uncharacterized protein